MYIWWNGGILFVHRGILFVHAGVIEKMPRFTCRHGGVATMTDIYPSRVSDETARTIAACAPRVLYSLIGQTWVDSHYMDIGDMYVVDMGLRVIMYVVVMGLVIYNALYGTRWIQCAGCTMASTGVGGLGG